MKIVHRYRVIECAILFIAIAAGRGEVNAGSAVSADQLAPALGGSVDDLLDFGNGPVATGSGFTTTFAGTAGETLSFEYNFLTDEDTTAGLDLVNDFAFAFLAGASPIYLADVATGPFMPSTTGFSQETGFRAFSLTLTTTGMFTLGIGVINVTDIQFDSALLVKNLSLDSNPLNGGDFTGVGMIGDARTITLADGTPGISISTIPEPSSIVILGLGLAGTAVCCKRRR